MHTKTYGNDETVPKMKNTLIKDEQKEGGDNQPDESNDDAEDDDVDVDAGEDSDDEDTDKKAGDEGIDDDNESDQDDPLPESGILGSQGGAS